MPDEPDFLSRVEVGGRVFWDTSGGGEGHLIVEAEVLALDDQFVTTRPVREWRVTPRGWDERRTPDAGVKQMRRNYFDRPLPVRIEQTKQFWHNVVGSFKDDLVFDEMVRLGREYNESTRPPADDGIVEPTQ